MSRVKGATNALKKRRTLLSKTKGYRLGRNNKERLAREAMLHAGAHAFADRRRKKRDFRTLWNIKIGAGAKLEGTSYSKLIGALRKKDISLNRKTLATLAEHYPDVFKEVITQAL
jgi:large subunit ribosomal protein L20